MSKPHGPRLSCSTSPLPQARNGCRSRPNTNFLGCAVWLARAGSPYRLRPVNRCRRANCIVETDACSTMSPVPGGRRSAVSPAPGPNPSSSRCSSVTGPRGNSVSCSPSNFPAQDPSLSSPASLNTMNFSNDAMYRAVQLADTVITQGRRFTRSVWAIGSTKAISRKSQMILQIRSTIPASHLESPHLIRPQATRIPSFNGRLYDPPSVGAMKLWRSAPIFL